MEKKKKKHWNFKWLCLMGRLGILVDFLSHSTILGFMGGTAVIICLQQLKGIFGLTHFTSKTDVYSVLHAVFSLRKEVCYSFLSKNGEKSSHNLYFPLYPFVSFVFCFSGNGKVLLWVSFSFYSSSLQGTW